MVPRGMPRVVPGFVGIRRASCTALVGAIAVLSSLNLAGCSSDDPTGVEQRPNPYDEWDGPDPREAYALTTYELDDLPHPPGNSPSDPGFDDRVELGRMLFFDHIMSGRRDVSCGSCHHPAMAWQDGTQLSSGVSGSGFGPERVLTDEHILLMPRNTPTSLNMGFNSEVPGGPPSHRGTLFWDGRVNGIEVQALQPSGTVDEMSGHMPRFGVHTFPDSAAADSVTVRLRSIPEYVDRFGDAFPTEAAAAVMPEEVIRRGTIERAMSSYQRELITIDSPFDQWVRGDDRAITIEQLRGADLFYGKANCASCHSGASFSDFSFSRLGVKDAEETPSRYPVQRGGNGVDIGRMEHTSIPSDVHKYRVPGLRNVELTGPWFRHGQSSSLREVILFHAIAGVAPDPQEKPEWSAVYEKLIGEMRFSLAGGPRFTPAMLDPRLQPVDLSDQEIDDLIAFLRSLTDRTIDGRVDPTVPERVPSGLAPVERKAPFSMVPMIEHVDVP